MGRDTFSFAGMFDGNGKEVMNFTCASADGDFLGLFRYAEGATIKDLGLIGPDVDGTARARVGSLVGFMGYGAVTGCYARDGRVSGSFGVGGLAGRAYASELYDCYSECSVSGGKATGGLLGINYGGTVTNCYSRGNVTGASEVGGLVGMNDFLLRPGVFQPGIISKCYAAGTVEGQTCVGGLAGDNLGRIANSYSTADVAGFGHIGGLVGHNYLWPGELVIPPAISNCCSSGSVRGIFSVGGLLGTDDGGTVSGSFWDVETSGRSASAGGTGKTTAEMQTAETFLNAGWDFLHEIANGTEEIWWILDQRTYPRFVWESSN